MDIRLHLIFHHVVNDEKWKAIKTSWTRPSISHLMFADYLLLFGQTT